MCVCVSSCKTSSHLHAYTHAIAGFLSIYIVFVFVVFTTHIETYVGMCMRIRHAAILTNLHMQAVYIRAIARRLMRPIPVVFATICMPSHDSMIPLHRLGYMHVTNLRGTKHSWTSFVVSPFFFVRMCACESRFCCASAAHSLIRSLIEYV